jgi:hypothetical protein
MRLDLMRDINNVFPRLDNPEELERLRIWHCKYKSLSPLSDLINLKELVIASFPDESLDALSGLKNLRYLSILHMPKVKNLSPLSSLLKLESLSIATLPSWDASRKRIIVESLDPIIKLPNLKYLELLGVRTEEGKLDILKNSRSLISARFSQYKEIEMDLFFNNTKVIQAYNPSSSFDM